MEKEKEFRMSLTGHFTKRHEFTAEVTVVAPNEKIARLRAMKEVREDPELWQPDQLEDLEEQDIRVDTCQTKRRKKTA